MALSVEYLKITEIAEYERNARIHSPEQIAQIVESIDEFGFTNPVLIDNNNQLIAGHGRLAAAQSIGMQEVPAIRLANLSEKQIKALRIVDNQLALNASYDLDLLAAELSELEEVEFDLELLGFDEDFLNGLLSDGPVPDDPDGDGENEAAAVESQNVAVSIGPYQFNVSGHEWSKWETSVRAKAGFDKEDIEREIQKRLGF